MFASAVVLLDASKKSHDLTTATVPAGTTFPPCRGIEFQDFETLVRQNNDWMVQTRRIAANLVVASVRDHFLRRGKEGVY
jgi:hypothetical protein